MAPGVHEASVTALKGNSGIFKPVSYVYTGGCVNDSHQMTWNWSSDLKIPEFPFDDVLCVIYL